MINNRNSPNLDWVRNPSDAYEGYWLAIRPTTQDLYGGWSEIKKIQNFVGAELRKEGITTWAPYTERLAHVSVFLGLTEQTTAKEKEAVMLRVAGKLVSNGAKNGPLGERLE
jgi:hypothetical protein